MTTHRTLAIVAALLAVAAAFVRRPLANASRPTAAAVDVTRLATAIEHEDDHVTALELAQWIRERKSGLRVIDVRSDSEFEAFHVPTAEHVRLSQIATLAPRAGESLVLYSEGGAHAAQAWVLLRALGHEHVWFLRGGLLDWMDDVMNPVRTTPAGNATADSAWARTSALSRYFGGVPRIGAVPVPTSKTVGDVPRATPDVVARTKRRGC